MSRSDKSSIRVEDESSTVPALASVIAEYPLLRGLEPQHLGRLAESAMRMHYEAGEFIFREGDPANRFYLIEQGRVSLESHPGEEAAVAVQVLGSGDALGWSW